MLVEAVAFFLGVSILFYCLFAGADFGAGILENVLSHKKHAAHREIISHAMGPVWEANHVWLILVVVILFNGFPKAYSALCLTLHIPLTLILVGVVLRGCAFTFRHYDVVKDRSQIYYSAVFRVSSLLTPMMLGVVAGATLLGRDRAPGGGFVETFVTPWANAFSFSVGLFTCSLFAFLAAVYLIGESHDQEIRASFVKRARWLNVFSIFVGVAVFVSAEIDGLSLTRRFVSEPLSLAAMSLAALLLFPLWREIGKDRRFFVRVLSAAQVALVLVGWFNLQFPVIMASSDPARVMTLYNSAAPEATLRLLLYALVIGSALIFPALIYLIRIFKFD